MSTKLIDFKQFLFRMSFGPAWAGGGPQLRDEAEGSGGIEAADHQPLGQRSEISIVRSSTGSCYTEG